VDFGCAANIARKALVFILENKNTTFFYSRFPAAAGKVHAGCSPGRRRREKPKEGWESAMAWKSDIEIAQETEMRDIRKIAKAVNIGEKALDPTENTRRR
jgi:hypothetical protein